MITIIACSKQTIIIMCVEHSVLDHAGHFTCRHYYPQAAKAVLDKDIETATMQIMNCNSAARLPPLPSLWTRKVSETRCISDVWSMMEALQLAFCLHRAMSWQSGRVRSSIPIWAPNPPGRGVAKVFDLGVLSAFTF